MEESNDIDTRVECIRALARKEVESDRAFKLLEECAISDEDLTMRAVAIIALISAYPHKSVKTVNWIIQNDDRVIVLNAIREGSCQSDSSHEEIFRTLRSRLATFYGVVEEETLPLLECEMLALSIKDDVIHKPRFEVDPRSKRVIGIDLGQVELLGVPEAITQFPCLEKLNLSENFITEIPDIWNKLPLLKKLTLEANWFLESIPDSLFQLSKKNFAAKYEREGVCPNEAPVLGLLEILCGARLKRYIDVSKRILKRNKDGTEEEFVDMHELGGVKFFREFFNNEIFYSVNKKGIVRRFFDADSDFQFYKRDEEGHVTGLNFRHFGKGHTLSLIPEQIGLLSRLKELQASDQYIRRVPLSICNLQELKILHLYCNCIESVPECVKNLKNLKVDNIVRRFLQEKMEEKKIIELKKVNLYHFS